ncbi:hypothetical protein, partial [Maricaulis sp.]|uniref:hypothetical protein n=1 Tax=Maricaulis sp. TaxID=1486257 RepID=UPI0025C6E7E8
MSILTALRDPVAARSDGLPRLFFPCPSDNNRLPAEQPAGCFSGPKPLCAILSGVRRGRQQMFRRYWPKSQADRHVDVASKRSLAGFCVLAGSAGIAVTGINLRFFAEAPAAVTIGGVAALMCLLAPLWVNANDDYKNRARLVGGITLTLLMVLAGMGKTLITPS